MFSVSVSLLGGVRPFSHSSTVPDMPALVKVEKALTHALKTLNDAAAQSAARPVPAGSNAKVDVTFCFDVKQGGADFCTSKTTWFGVDDAHQAGIADAFAPVGHEVKAAHKR